jgi:hypothetical protein
MDLATAKPLKDSHNVQNALYGAGQILELIEKPRYTWGCDAALLKHAGMSCGIIGFPQLLAAYQTEVIATELRMTPYQQNEQKRYEDRGKNFLPYMIKTQRETLKRALESDVQLFIATARRFATEAKLFDGLLLASSSSGSSTIADTRGDLLALQTETQEQIIVLQRRLAAIDKAGVSLSHIENGITGADNAELLFAPPPASMEQKQQQKRAKH